MDFSASLKQPQPAPQGGLCWSGSPGREPLLQPGEDFQLYLEWGGAEVGQKQSQAPGQCGRKAYAIQRGQARPSTRVVDLFGFTVGTFPEPDLGSKVLHVRFR